MYANILLSTDGSDVARKGVEHGMDLAKALKAKVTVITVTEPLPVDHTGGQPLGWTPLPGFGSGPAGEWTPEMRPRRGLQGGRRLTAAPRALHAP
jgi:nucleotide-binding universal stress UspA family protein